MRALAFGACVSYTLVCLLFVATTKRIRTHYTLVRAAWKDNRAGDTLINALPCIMFYAERPLSLSN